MGWEWIEGSRTFDLVWGFATGAICLALAFPILWWWLPQHRRSFFGTAVDPHYRLQFWYGIFCMAMVFTNVGCRVIPHDDLALVHPTFFVITLGLAIALGPRAIAMALSRDRSAPRTSVPAL